MSVRQPVRSTSRPWCLGETTSRVFPTARFPSSSVPRGRGRLDEQDNPGLPATRPSPPPGKRRNPRSPGAKGTKRATPPHGLPSGPQGGIPDQRRLPRQPQHGRGAKDPPSATPPPVGTTRCRARRTQRRRQPATPRPANHRHPLPTAPNPPTPPHRSMDDVMQSCMCAGYVMRSCVQVVVDGGGVWRLGRGRGVWNWFLEMSLRHQMDGGMETSEDAWMDACFGRSTKIVCWA
jgi:hypothetical protein